MPCYFMRDTPLQALEQLMMSQPGQKPRGGGIYRSPFHYTPKDVACEYCQNYVRKHPCRLCECTCLKERIEAGALELNEFVRDCFAPSMGPQLRKRMHQQFGERKVRFFLSDAHRRRWTHWRERCWRLSDRNKAALFLLTAYESLWRRMVWKCGNDGFDFQSVRLGGIEPELYSVYQAAKAIAVGCCNITLADLASPELVTEEAFHLITGALLMAKYAAYHVTERGQEWYFKTSPGEELLAVGKKLRGYLTKGNGVAPDKFIGMFFGGQPLTAKEFDDLTALRMENTGKVRGVFDVNFDKREFSAVHIMDGWKTWAMRDVSVAVYHATRSQFASGDDKWRKLLDRLKGKEITSAGHLSAQNFSFGEEIIESDGKLNFYLQADFDVDAAFGTYVCTDQNDDWLNIYANYDVEQDRLCDTLELNLCKGDGSEESWSYPLNAAEQEVLLRKMEAFCQQQTGMSLHEYAQQLRDSESQTPEMQM